MSIPFEDHIWDLAHEHDINVRWIRARAWQPRIDGSHRATAQTWAREVTLSWQARGEDAYWCLLHEMGHIVLNHRGLPDTPEGSAGEADAWQWALDQSIPTPSLHQCGLIFKRLQNYVSYRGDHPRVAEVQLAFLTAAGAPNS